MRCVSVRHDYNCRSVRSLIMTGATPSGKRAPWRRRTPHCHYDRRAARAPVMPDLTRAEQAELDRRRATARAKACRLIETADPAADAAVVAAAKADPDARPMTGAALARMRPAHEVHPEELAAAGL